MLPPAERAKQVEVVGQSTSSSAEFGRGAGNQAAALPFGSVELNGW